VKTLREALTSLIGSQVESRVRIGIAKDGSGVGGKPFKTFISLLNQVFMWIFLFPTAALGALVAVKNS